jgi:hypothetical protein
VNAASGITPLLFLDPMLDLDALLEPRWPPGTSISLVI